MKPGRLIVTLCIGVAAIAYGAFLSTKTTATCNGRSMGPDDRCITISHHGFSRVARDSAQQLSKTHDEGYTLIGVGALFMVVTVVFMVARRRSPAAAAPAYGAPPSGPAGGPYPQYGPYGQQPPAAGGPPNSPYPAATPYPNQPYPPSPPQPPNGPNPPRRY
ncbi:hypothetical protein [Actinoallomurus sp. NPDC050550]|uniref:hypothetical protein n=1 Tax=Actinoallomurus sp. NPDC050550 TaxID=3154937 RepID=UPI00340DAF34